MKKKRIEVIGAKRVEEQLIPKHIEGAELAVIKPVEVEKEEQIIGGLDSTDIIILGSALGIMEMVFRKDLGRIAELMEVSDRILPPSSRMRFYMLDQKFTTECDKIVGNKKAEMVEVLKRKFGL